MNVDMGCCCWRGVGERILSRVHPTSRRHCLTFSLHFIATEQPYSLNSNAFSISLHIEKECWWSMCGSNFFVSERKDLFPYFLKDSVWKTIRGSQISLLSPTLLLLCSRRLHSFAVGVSVACFGVVIYFLVTLVIFLCFIFCCCRLLLHWCL